MKRARPSPPGRNAILPAHRSSLIVHRLSLSSRSGFTLMEVLLVVAIMLIVAGMALPRFMGSYQGAKLRSSMRTVVMANRYARGMAVLNQKHTAILFDTAKSELEIVSMESALGQAGQSRFLDQHTANLGFEKDDDSPPEAVESAPISVGTELTRGMAEGIRIDWVEVKDAEQEHDGIYWVNYFPNGMCDKFSLRLVDEQDLSAVLYVDPLSGSAKVEYEY